MRMPTFAVLLATSLLVALGAGCSPITLVERAVEARRGADIIEDNRIVLAVNKFMADLRTIKASTEIYEQRLLVTGLFDDPKLLENFRRRVRSVKGIKKLYWHAIYLSKAEQKRQSGRLLDWSDVIVLDAKVGAGLIGTRAVADVNYRVAADSRGTVYLLGRARSKTELDKALRVARGVKGVRRLINYVVVRP